MTSSITNSSSILERFAFRQIAVDSIAVFRVAFGAILFWEVVRYFLNGWVETVYIAPPVHFTYWGFSWVHPLPGGAMYLVFLALGFASACVCLGLFYRVAIVGVFVGMTYIFLLEKAVYLNHAYLICLISFLMMFVPAHRRFSFDARFRPGVRSETISVGCLWLLRFQIGLPYFYGGIAKLNPDWLQGQPMQLWLMKEAQSHSFLPGLDSVEMALFFSYGGLLLDLFIVPALLWRRTRKAAFVLAVMFHVTNSFLFHIGIFPWMMICATTLYLEPDWPRRWLGKLESPRERTAKPRLEPNTRSHRNRLWVGLAGVWCVVHLLVPLRHWLYSNDVNWSEQGYRFSWRMMLNEKFTLMQVVYDDPQTGRVVRINPLNPPPPLKPLTLQQTKRVSQYPDMLQQYAVSISEQLADAGQPNASVRALVLCSLNTRKPQLLVDPRTNLVAVPRGFETWDWVVPLEEPLPEKPWLIPPTKWPQSPDLDLSELTQQLLTPEKSAP